MLVKAPKLLLVEDETLLAYQIEDVLTLHGFEVVHVSNGRSAAEKIQANLTIFAALSPT
ncbi:hypothetical protein [Brucella intermedia]|uniref:hypothetical protein n=1 Tax=Brucella intermedia TaxID=94625 RepID=UPI002248F945|nr:hypothetical protein [Brucella intermedia]